MPVPDGAAMGLHLRFTLRLGETLTAINRPVRFGFKGDPGFAPAGRAYGSEVLPGPAGSGLTGITAGFAALGLILEAALCIELLLTGGEHELLSTLFAY